MVGREREGKLEGGFFFSGDIRVVSLSSLGIFLGFYYGLFSVFLIKLYDDFFGYCIFFFEFLGSVFLILISVFLFLFLLFGFVG